ncbi:FMN-linked oxidoreductase [Gyrodon lividus]|nr:FMN-linked oxidoreductase [Gyrodon lividus]
MTFANLLRPLQIGPHRLKNRVVMSALTRSRSVPTNVPNDLNLEYYTQRARGGAGLITTEGTLVVPQGTEWQNAPGIWSKEQVAAWKKITASVHAEGTVIFNQLWHLGRVSHPEAPEQKASGLVAPSAKAARGGKFRFLPGQPGYVTPTEVPDPTTIIKQFRKAAINAKEAGFDGVELHGANGYLVHQFLDSTANQRTDEWGGSVENRCKFGLQILKELISIWGSKRVAVRLSPAGGYNDVGMPLEETIATYKHFISCADDMDLAYIALVRYHILFNPVIDGKHRATQHDVLESYRPNIKKSALFLNAGLTPEEAEGLVAQNKIDAAAFGTLWIGHPDVTKRLEHGAPLDNKLDPTTLYGHGPQSSPEELKKGYTDYPASRLVERGKL